MKFGIIIPFYNNFNFTNMCVESIRAYSHNYQIIFIDNGSDLSTKKQMGTLLKPDDILITNEKNLGFAKAINQGLKKANTEFICLLNNDVKFKSDCLAQAENYFHQFGGFIGQFGYCISSNGVQVYRGTEVDYLGLFFFLSSKKNFDLVGPLSEDYGLAYWEDVDYGMRILQKGLKSHAFPSIDLVHCTCATAKLLGSTVLAERCSGKNKNLFLSRWKAFLKSRGK